MREMIAGAPGGPQFRSLLTALMARPGRVLNADHPAKWPAFVLLPCHVLGGDGAAALPAAAAVEFAVGAADVADDLIDHEWASESIAPERAINAGLALTLLAQRCLSDIATLGADRARLIGDLIVGGGLAACAGEDSDFLLESVVGVGEDDALEVTRRKSGSLVAAACQVGAAVATDVPEVLALVGTFGERVGIAAQLINDLGGAAGPGNDLRRKKKTLPVAYALRCAQEEDIPEILEIYETQGDLPEPAQARLATTIRALGGTHYAWVVAEAHRREAFAALAALTSLTGRPEVRQLRRLVPAIPPERAT